MAPPNSLYSLSMTKSCLHYIASCRALVKQGWTNTTAAIAQSHCHKVEGKHKVTQSHQTTANRARLQVRHRDKHRFHEGFGRIKHGQTLQPAANAQTKDRKSTRLNSSHVKTSYAVFCVKNKTPV